MEAPLNHKFETIPHTPVRNTGVDTSSEWGSQSPIYPRDDKDAWNLFKDQRSIIMSYKQEFHNWEDDIIDDFSTNNALTQHLPEGPNSNDHDDEESDYDSRKNNTRQPNGLLDDSNDNKPTIVKPT